MRIRYSNRRAIVSLRGLVRLRLKIRRCESRSCGRYHQAWRPEGEAALALPQWFKAAAMGSYDRFAQAYVDRARGTRTRGNSARKGGPR